MSTSQRNSEDDVRQDEPLSGQSSTQSPQWPEIPLFCKVVLRIDLVICAYEIAQIAWILVAAWAAGVLWVLAGVDLIHLAIALASVLADFQLLRKRARAVWLAYVAVTGTVVHLALSIWRPSTIDQFQFDTDFVVRLAYLIFYAVSLDLYANWVRQASSSFQSTGMGDGDSTIHQPSRGGSIECAVLFCRRHSVVGGLIVTVVLFRLVAMGITSSPLLHQGAGGEVTLKGHSNGIYCVAFSPDGARIAVGDFDGAAKIWDAATGKEMLTLAEQDRDVIAGGVFCVAFSLDGTQLATGSFEETRLTGFGTLKLWNATTGRLTSTLKIERTQVNSVAFSPDGQRIASAHTDGTVRVWDVAAGREMLLLGKKSQEVIKCVAFSPDGARLVAASDGSGATLWDTATGNEILTFAALSHSIAFSPDGTRIAGGLIIVSVVDATTGQKTLTLEDPRGVNSVAFSPDGTLLATGSNDETVKLWDATNGQMLHTLQGHRAQVNSVAFSPDGKRIASGSSDTSVKVWDVPRHK